MNRPQQSVDYRMPIPHRGQIVLWYEGGVRNEERACPAIVKVDNHSSLHLHVFAIDNEFDTTCVRHLDDPNTKEWDKTENGCWDFCQPDRKASVASEQKKLVETK